MKNNASNPSKTQAITQALRVQATQLLPALTAALIQLDYDGICHQRLSQQDNNNTISYQGLTRAQHLQFGHVMIKWELIPDSNADHSSDISNLNVLYSSSLSHEIAVLAALNTTQLSRNNIASIAPALLNSQSSRLQVLNQIYQLTLLIMPYYKNGSLAHYLRQYPLKQQPNNKPLSAQQKYQLILKSARLIFNLHHSGWLHNDIKPSNVLLERSFPLDSFSLSNANDNNVTPQLLLTDFALAQRLDGFDIANTAGTPAYLAPERWQGQGATEQSDIYAFGIMMYEVLTGARPLKIIPKSSVPLKDWAIEHCQQPVQTLPKEYQHYQPIINKALAKRVEKRYGSMEELLGDLERLKVAKATHR